jgi:hypothetical protein
VNFKIRIRSHLASECIVKPLADYLKLKINGGTPFKLTLAQLSLELAKRFKDLK